MRCLVTGAGGFIGSHLVERLVNQGAEVTAMVHYNALGSSGWLDYSQARQSLVVERGDINDADMIRRLMREKDTVFHLAALIGIPYSYSSPHSYVSTNILGTLNVLTAARDLGTPRVVHTSTSEVYGTAVTTPMNESHPLRAQSPYAATKIAADKLAESFHLSFGLPVVTLRPFNTFGPRQSQRAVIPTVISQALKSESISIGNLKPERDFNYVANTVDGFVRAASTPGIEGQTINIGSGETHSIETLVKLVGDLLGKDLTVTEEHTRKRKPTSEVEKLQADADLARTILGWAPEVSFEEGIVRTIDWIKKSTNVTHWRDYAV